MSYQKKYEQLAEATASMRYWQNRFFRYKKRDDLTKAREHEARVDSLIRDFKAGKVQIQRHNQQSLF